jgi:putative CocE/NonD family hydrolase
MNRSLVWRRGLAALLVCWLAGLASLSHAPAQDDKKPVPEPEALPAKLSGFHDAGVFHLYKDEELLLRNTFTWKEDGAVESKSVLELAGQKLTTSFTVTTDKQGYWTRIVGASRLGPFDMERTGGQIKRTQGNKTKTFTMKPGAGLVENFSPALISQSLRAYDAAKGGKQKLPLIIIPDTEVTATLERKDMVERSVAGKDLKLTRYQLVIAVVELTVWADTDGKVYLVEVPSQSVAFVREGYEALRKVEVNDPLLSRPEFKIKEEPNLRAPMRDGVKLGTDIYRPDRPGKYPAILVRTPYKKEMNTLTGKYYARRGYVVAIQDCRGRFSSEGVWEPFFNEPKDGFDTVEWLAAQPWCSGKVGMIGGSYLGWVQWWAAAQRPPHLVTIIPNVSPPDPFYNMPYEYGAFFLWGAIWWADVLETGATADISGKTLKQVMDKKYHQLLKKLPVIDLDKVVLGKENRYWRQWIEHPTDDAFWQAADFHRLLDKVDIPVFHQSGWFDGDGIGTKLNYLRMASLGHKNQKLILGPWGHTDVATRGIGKYDFGPQALRDLPRDYLRWFDFWLKGVENGVLKEPLVSIFVMKSNKWLHGPTYPLPQTRFEKWYLTSGGKANTPLGDGKLSRQLPPKDSPPDHYTYDPADPTPDPDFLEKEEEEKVPPKAAKGDQAEDKAPAKTGKKESAEKDRRAEVVQKRRDMLVYVSEPFAEEYTFAGPITAVLYASTSAKDTDWIVRLMTIDPKGKVFPLTGLTGGKIRARFRESMSKPSLLEPGNVYKYALDLWQTGISVPKEHRLRVEVSSAAFPLFSRNLNTGGQNETETSFVTAEQTIYHNAEYPSHLVLPMIPEETPKKK